MMVDEEPVFLTHGFGWGGWFGLSICAWPLYSVRWMGPKRGFLAGTSLYVCCLLSAAEEKSGRVPK